MSVKNVLSPFFSVIIPLYNKAGYVERALHSVLAQLEEDFEVLVIDDGSADNGGMIARSVIDTRITVVSQNNQGVASARNKGMALASGQWLAFLHHSRT